MLEIQGKFYDWDPNKNRRNIQKHGVSFKEAASTFQDKNALYFDDYRHSQSENRFIIIGKSKTTRMLYTCYCYRESDTIIRIISARDATENESRFYGGVE